MQKIAFHSFRDYIMTDKIVILYKIDKRIFQFTRVIRQNLNGYVDLLNR